MNKKKVLAFLLATTMVLGSSMSVFAATGDAENTTGETVTGEGDVDYVDTTVYSVTLPTTATITLKVDPQGLLGMTGDTASAEELEEYAGRITCASTPSIVNLSSVPMKVSAALTLTGDATAVKTVASVNSTDKANNVLLYAVPSAVDIQEDEENYVGSTVGVVLSGTKADVDFVLPAAEYVFKKDASAGDAITYEAVEGTGHGTALSFGGYVNKLADWSDYTKASEPKKIGMTAVFTFTSTLGGAEADSASGAPYAMVAYTGDKVTVEPTEAAPTFTASETPGVINYKAGAGEIGLDKSKTISIWHQYGTKWYDAANDVEIGASTITYKEASLAKFSSDINVQITYINNAGESKKVDLVVKAK